MRAKVKDSRGVQLERGDCFPSHLHRLHPSKTFSVCLIHTLYPQGQGQSRSWREKKKIHKSVIFITCGVTEGLLASAYKPL